MLDSYVSDGLNDSATENKFHLVIIRQRAEKEPGEIIYHQN